MKINKTRTDLSNGLPLVVIEVPGLESAVVSCWTKAGSRFNPEGKEGLAHFLEHVVLKKTKKHNTDLKLANYLETKGIWKNGWTHKDYVFYEITSPAKNIKYAIDILSQMILDPLIDDKAVAQEREIIKKEIVRKASQPDLLIWDTWYKVFFQGTSLEYSNLDLRPLWIG